MMLVALAGPGINLVLALVAAIVLGVLAGDWSRRAGRGFVVDMLFNFLLVNVFLALFNLIPLPPFDGGHVVEGAAAAARWCRRGQRMGAVRLSAADRPAAGAADARAAARTSSRSWSRRRAMRWSTSSSALADALA